MLAHVGALSTRAQVEAGKSDTCGAQPPPTSWPLGWCQPASGLSGNCVRAEPKPRWFGQLNSPVQGEIEDVEVAQSAVFANPVIGRIRWTRQHERNRLLREPAVRAQSMTGESGEVVLIRPRANCGVCVAHCDEITLPLRRHFIARGCACSVKNQRYAGNARGCV